MQNFFNRWKLGTSCFIIRQPSSMLCLLVEQYRFSVQYFFLTLDDGEPMSRLCCSGYLFFVPFFADTTNK